MANSLQDAIPKILEDLDALPPQVLRPKELSKLLGAMRESWEVRSSVTQNGIIRVLVESGRLRIVQPSSRNYGTKTRYVLHEPSPYQVALTLGTRGQAYLSHATAVLFHGLTDELPQSILVNQEQSPKPPRAESELQQSRIDVAFLRKQRESNYIFAWEGSRAIVLSGKNTSRLEVGELPGPNNELLPVTKLERTLIDIVVRPTYAGGILHVAEAFRAARERVSTNVLVATLKKLAYLYPYHQAIGFLMERAGYERRRLEMLREMGLNYDFYLQHGMSSPDYDASWRLYYPKGLQLR